MLLRYFPYGGLKDFSYSEHHGDDAISDGADGLGWPTCKRWRKDSTDGLRKHLLADISNGSMKGKMGEWLLCHPHGSPHKLTQVNLIKAKQDSH